MKFGEFVIGVSGKPITSKKSPFGKISEFRNRHCVVGVCCNGRIKIKGKLRGVFVKNLKTRDLTLF